VHCETCRWWENPIREWFKTERWTSWRTTNVGLCVCEDRRRYHVHTLPNIESVAMDLCIAVIESDEGWSLLTGPTFFCAHWEE
jgi:hypothetical protein